MKVYVSSLLFSLVLAAYVAPVFNQSDSYDPAKQCPDPRKCGRPSAPSDFLCYLNNVQAGLNFVLVGFSTRICAYCSFYFNCQPAIAGILKILDVYGYIINMTNPKTGPKEPPFLIIYIDVSVDGCPQFQDLTYIEATEQNSPGYVTSIKHGPTSANLTYYFYRALYQDYNLSCNTFTSVPGGYSCPNNRGSSCGCAYTKVQYYSETSYTNVDFSHTTNLVVLQDVTKNNSTSSSQDIVDTFGVYMNCDSSPQAEPDSDNRLGGENCVAQGYNNKPYCNRIKYYNTLDSIIASYYYKIPRRLDANAACKISRLFAQGYNYPTTCQNDYHDCNCDSFNSFVVFAFFIDTGFQDYGAVGALFRGYCDDQLQKDIMKKFFTLC